VVPIETPRLDPKLGRKEISRSGYDEGTRCKTSIDALNEPRVRGEVERRSERRTKSSGMTRNSRKVDNRLETNFEYADTHRVPH
jgi:hypothetical protein